MPSSVLRPYNDASDGIYVPTLLKSKYAAWLPASNQLFLLHPIVLSVLIGSASGAAYYVNNLFQNVLTVPGDPVVYSHEETWKDNIAAGIYVIPAIAAIVGALFALGYWYHSRLWSRFSNTEARKADVVDISAYYRHPTSKFWCLEYESQIVAAWGVDGRNPARPLQTIDEERIPKTGADVLSSTGVNDAPRAAAPLLNTSATDNQEEDAEYDLALFRHSTTSPVSQSNATTTLTALASMEAAKPAEPVLQEADLKPAGPSLLPASVMSSFQDPSSLAEIRHLTLSETYQPTKGVEGHILAIAVQSAFTTSDRIKHVIIRLDPKLEKAFRSHALQGGFRIIRNDVPLENTLDKSTLKNRLESIARLVWPLSFESEILMLDKSKWQMPKP